MQSLTQMWEKRLNWLGNFPNLPKPPIRIGDSGIVEPLMESLPAEARTVIIGSLLNRIVAGNITIASRRINQDVNRSELSRRFLTAVSDHRIQIVTIRMSSNNSVET
jgi:hypothetical protein